ncbi:hypothetical protein Hanom_Chr08g00692581 [Helianthus anomalus]
MVFKVFLILGQLLVILLLVVKHCSTCEVYGKTIGSFLPKDSPLHQDPAYYVLKEDTSPCIFGLVEKLKSIDGRMYVPNN